MTRHNNQYGSNIPKYYLYTAFKGFGFGLFTAIWLIYLQQQRGLTLSQATLIDIAFWIAATVGEIPTGVVADIYGRKTSLIIGAAVMGISVILWALAPTIPLIALAYIFFGLGITFLSGAEDALLYESIQITGRGADYTRLVGRTGAVLLGATALGNVASGLMGSLNLLFPFIAASLSLIAMLIVVFTIKEPRSERKAEKTLRKSYGAILRQTFTLMRSNPRLRYAILFLTLTPLASFVIETFFVQPQSIALGVPIAGVGVVVMAVQIMNLLGSTFSDQIKLRVGEKRVFYSAPILIVASLVLLAVFQIFPSLIFIALMGFVTAVLHPILLNRIQTDVPDDIRATLLSVQSLMFTFLLAASEPILGVVADRSGLPATYVVLASVMGSLSLFLLWKGNCHLLRSVSTSDTNPDCSATAYPIPAA